MNRTGTPDDVAFYRQLIERNYTSSLKTAQPVRIRLGIDFGTSNCKVVWRLDETSYPLCFGDDRTSLNSYLIPSAVSIEGDQLLFGFETKDLNNKITNFKICLACESRPKFKCDVAKCELTDWRALNGPPKPFSLGTEFVAAYFLARLIHLTKSRVRAELNEKGFPNDVSVKWSACIPVPEKFVDESAVNARFEHVLRTAWVAADVFEQIPDLHNIRSIKSVVDAAKAFVADANLNGRKFDCSTYPEVGAEVAAITLSPTSEDGLYAFVDVGAGTLDASVFRFFRHDGDAHKPPYAAEVLQLGAAHFEHRAARRMPSYPVELFRAVKEGSCLTSFQGSDDHARIFRALKLVAREIRAEAARDLTQLFRLAYAKENREERWLDLKLILGGGGSALMTYRKASEHAFTLKSRNKTPEIIELSAPGDCRMGLLFESHFHRFAVAYGLSWGRVYLPEIVTPREVSPLRPLRTRSFVDPTNDG